MQHFAFETAVAHAGGRTPAGGRRGGRRAEGRAERPQSGAEGAPIRISRPGMWRNGRPNRLTPNIWYGTMRPSSVPIGETVLTMSDPSAGPYTSPGTLRVVPAGDVASVPPTHGSAFQQAAPLEDPGAPTVRPTAAPEQPTYGPLPEYRWTQDIRALAFVQPSGDPSESPYATGQSAAEVVPPVYTDETPHWSGPGLFAPLAGGRRPGGSASGDPAFGPSPTVSARPGAATMPGAAVAPASAAGAQRPGAQTAGAQLAGAEFADQEVRSRRWPVGPRMDIVSLAALAAALLALGPVAILLGWLGLRRTRRGRPGRMAAVTAMVLGVLETAFFLIISVMALQTSSHNTFGDDARLDALWRTCEAGGPQGCDELQRLAPAGTEYERFGDTCGGRYQADGTYALGCTDRMNVPRSAAAG